MKKLAPLLLLFTVSCFSTSQKTIDTDTFESIQPIAPAQKFEQLGEEVFGKPIQVISAEEIFSLTPKQEQEFLNYFHSADNANESSNIRISNYLDDHLHGFNYYSQTLTATEALEGFKGNCLTLAIVTKSLSNLAGIVEDNIKYQLVETEPVYQKKNNIVISSQHIRTKLLNPIPKDSVVFWRGGVYIDYFTFANSRTLRTVDEAEFISMYYTNKAAEMLIHQDYNLAYWYLQAAIKNKLDAPITLNMLALLHERKGFDDYAERIYLFALSKAKYKLELLQNYYTLLKRTGRTIEAKRISKQINDYHDPNPFSWISLANKAYNSEDYSKALSYYEKAKRMAPYLHEIYAGIARTQYQLGNLDSAELNFNKALETSYIDSTKKIYQAKISMLTELIKSGTPVLQVTREESLIKD